MMEGGGRLKKSRRPTTESHELGRSGGASRSRRNGKGEDLGEMAKHYPWLAKFDNEAKTNLTGQEVTNDNVIKLLTSLESYISPEVTKLKNKPNRATKFLGQVRKRISLVKMGGYLMDRDCERQLFPTYGLLISHFVNITLTSSKVEKVGAETVAQELYYLLKLIFQEDPEYVLDVALCSTLDEHAGSKHKVGFHVFSYIVEDWRYFGEGDSPLMKYCAVASLLSEASPDRRIFVERTVPSDMHRGFPKFLFRNNVDIGGGSFLKKKPTSLRSIIQTMKVTQVKSISRGRLVIVSRKNVSRSIRELSDEDDDSDAESTSSTLVNMPQRLELPSSSGLKSQGQEITDPMSSFFNEIGLVFSLDTVGNGNLRQESNSSTAATGYSYDRDFDGDYLDDEDQEEDCHVSSSSTVQQPRWNSSTSSSQLLNDIKIEAEDGHSTLEIDADADNEEEDYESDRKNLRSRRRSARKRKSSDIETRDTASSLEDDDDQHLNDTAETVRLNGVDSLESVDDKRGDETAEDSQDREEEKDIPGYEPCSDNEEEREPVSDFDDDYYESRRHSPTKSAEVSGGTENLEKENLNADDDDSSDLEILSEKALSKDSDDDDDDANSVRSKDEAEPESGEDYVPNYDVDSDEEVETGNSVQVEDKGVEMEDEENKNEGEVADSQEEILQDSSNNSENPASDNPGQDIVAPPAAENETDQQKGDETIGNEDEEESSPPGSPILTTRKSSRVSAKCKTPVQRSSALGAGAGRKATATPKSTKSQKSSPSPPKKLKLGSDDDEVEDDDYDVDQDKESEDTFSQDSLEPLSSQRGRRGKSAGAYKAIKYDSDASVSTRRSTRSTRVTPRFTPPKFTKKDTRARTSPVSVASTSTPTASKTRTTLRSAKAPVEKAEKTTTVTTRGRGRGRGRTAKK